MATQLTTPIRELLGFLPALSGQCVCASYLGPLVVWWRLLHLATPHHYYGKTNQASCYRRQEHEPDEIGPGSFWSPATAFYFHVYF